MARVFIVHGRDIEGRDAVVSFLKQLELQHLDFSDVSTKLGGAPAIADIINTGIHDADAVLILFTPDEHAALYDPSNGRLLAHDPREPSGARWQARPNVIFEAGIAFGIAREKVILVALGVDELFSDLHGLVFVKLHAPDGPARLRAALGAVLKCDLKRVDATFTSRTRERWSYYDEVENLAEDLRSVMLRSQGEPVSLLDVVATVVVEPPIRGQGPSASLVDASLWTPRMFCQAIASRYRGLGGDAFWWLMARGFFAHKDGESGWFAKDPDSYEDWLEYSDVTKRARMLIERIRARGPGMLAGK
jgi:CAP12/Pycsar effector protein, TIR domain